MGLRQGSLIAALLSIALPVSGCAIPDQGNAPLRRMVWRLKHLPETESRQASLPTGALATFELSVDAPLTLAGRIAPTPLRIRAIVT